MLVLQTGGQNAFAGDFLEAGPEEHRLIEIVRRRVPEIQKRIGRPHFTPLSICRTCRRKLRRCSCHLLKPGLKGVSAADQNPSEVLLNRSTTTFSPRRVFPS